MIRNRFIAILAVGTLGAVAGAASANTGVALEVTATDLERLGVVLQEPEVVDEIEIVSSPAEIVIPPQRQAIVSSTLSGVLARVLVAEGDTVSAGQPLAEIRSADLLDHQHEFIEAALTADLAEAQLERDRGLFADGIIAERRVQEAVAAERLARAALDQARQELELAGMADAELTRLLETGELTAGLTLRAPFDGLVVEQLASLGQRIDSLEPVHRIADLTELWLELNVPLERSQGVLPGMPVVAESGGRVLGAQVIQVGRVSRSATQTVMIRARIEGSDARLRAGEYLLARVLNPVGSGDDVIVVPAAAIVRDAGNTYVFARSGEDIVARRVAIVAEAGSRTFIRGDLDRDVEIATSGVAALKSIWLAAAEEEN